MSRACRWRSISCASSVGGITRTGQVARDTTAGGAAAALPAERHFPLPAVIMHGVLADVTLVLILLTALGARG